jgi:hypothetical protein
MKTIKLLNDLFQKRALSLETLQSKKYVSLIIYEATGIIVDTIQPLDRVKQAQLNRLNHQNLILIFLSTIIISLISRFKTIRYPSRNYRINRSFIYRR